MTNSKDDRTPTSDADPLAAQTDNAEIVPNTDADHPIDDAGERAAALTAASEEPPAGPTPRPAPESGASAPETP